MGLAARFLFVYGTLQEDRLVRRLLGRRPRSLPALAPGYRARKVRGRPWPGLVPCPDDVTRGRLLLGLTGRDLARLDAYEGGAYRREELVVRLADGRGLAVQAYLYRRQLRGGLSRRRWPSPSRPGAP